MVPNTYKVPVGLETKNFKLHMLTVNDVEKDYEAVISSIKHLRRIFAEHDIWPSINLSL